MRFLTLCLFVALPLQWLALGSTPLGTARLHQITILFIAVAILARYRLRAHSPVLRTASGFLAANLFLLAVWAAADLYNGVKPFGSVQELLYLIAFVALATLFYRAATGKIRGMVSVLRWAALTACLSVVLGFAISMVVNGVNPVPVISQTVATANPELLQKEVFKSSFASFGLDAETVEGNLRHEIFGAVLFAMYVSAWAMRVGGRVTAAQRAQYRVAMAVGAVLLAFSLSRSVLIAAAVWPAIALVRSIFLGRLSTRQLTLAFVGIAAVGGLAVSGFGLVIWNRFTTDTTGYDAREQNYSDSFAALKDHWLTGGVGTSGMHVSSHNFIVDNWLRGGIFTGLGAAIVLGMVAVIWVRLVARVAVGPEWMVPVTAALALPLVRMGTAGGGLIPPVEWVALAFVAGVLAMRREAWQPPDDEPAPGLVERTDYVSVRE